MTHLPVDYYEPTINGHIFIVMGIKYSLERAILFLFLSFRVSL